MAAVFDNQLNTCATAPWWVDHYNYMLPVKLGKFMDSIYTTWHLPFFPFCRFLHIYNKTTTCGSKISRWYWHLVTLITVLRSLRLKNQNQRNERSESAKSVKPVLKVALALRWKFIACMGCLKVKTDVNCCFKNCLWTPDTAEKTHCAQEILHSSYETCLMSV